MYKWLAVMAGGAIGAGARYAVGRAFAARDLTGFPWATLAVNLAGGFAMGVLAGWLLRGMPEIVRLFVGVGVLGGFTTFSAFSWETVEMMERGADLAALAYIGASVLGAVGFTMIGYALVRP